MQIQIQFSLSVVLLVQIQIQFSLYSEQQVTFYAMVSRRHPWLCEQTPGRWSHQATSKGHAVLLMSLRRIQLSALGPKRMQQEAAFACRCICSSVSILASRKAQAYSLSNGGYP